MQKPKIPNFTILEFCGKGSSSEVWLGQDRDGVRRAIKIMDITDPDKLKTIEKENNAICAYRNIVNRNSFLLDIIYIGRTPRYLYYITELADNASKTPGEYLPDTLALRLKERKFDREEILGTMNAIVSGVAFLHSHGMGHCDIKPENIVFVNGQLRIADPGLMCRQSGKPAGGTDGFRPERESTSMENDIYAAGKILYCLYSGNDALSYPSLPAGINFNSICKFNNITMRCCSENLREHFSSINQVADALHRLDRQDFLKIIRNNRIWIYLALLLSLLLTSITINLMLYNRLQEKRISQRTYETIITLAEEQYARKEIETCFKLLQQLQHWSPNTAAADSRVRALRKKVEPLYLWYKCMNWRNILGPDIFLLTPDLEILSADDKNEIIQRTIRSDPGFAATLHFQIYNYRLLMERAPNSPAAEDAFRKIIQHSRPDDNAILYDLHMISIANFISSRGDHENALKVINKACDSKPNSYIVYIVRAAIYIKMQKFEMALQDLRRVLREHSNNIIAVRLMFKIPPEVLNKFNSY